MWVLPLSYYSPSTVNTFLDSLYIPFTHSLFGKFRHHDKLKPWDNGLFFNSLDNGMILLTRLNGSKLYINAEKVMTVEGTPDTIITLADHVKYVVKEIPEVVVEMILKYHQRIHNPDFNSGKEN